MGNKKLTSIIFAGTLALGNFAFAEEKKAEKDLLDSFGLETKDYVLLSDKEAAEIRGSPNTQVKDNSQYRLKCYSSNLNVPIYEFIQFRQYNFSKK